MSLKPVLLAILILAGPGLRAQEAAEPEPRLVSMGTGSVAGVYYPVGVSLCRLVNQTRREHGLRCSAQPTAGSLGNMQALREGGLDMALVQSDVQAAAHDGTEDVVAFADLRAVMSLYAEALTVVAGPDTGIATLRDLEGKRVALEAEGTGGQLLVEGLMEALGWTEDSFAATPELDATDLAQALCAGAIDAYMRVVGHPALLVQETTNACQARLIPVAGPEIEALVDDVASYVPATIPGGLYRENPEPVATFGVGATLVTSAELQQDAVYTIVSNIFEDFETLRGLNPALTDLEAQEMAQKGLSAPLHAGAEQYYRERGWLE